MISCFISYLLLLTLYLPVKMLFNRDRQTLNQTSNQNLIYLLLTAVFMGGTVGQSAMAQDNYRYFEVTVNSDRDEIKADRVITLREAIELVNNTLNYAQLSSAEQQQVKQLSNSSSQIKFAFAKPVKIELKQVLPPLTSPGLVIDGTSHPQYDANQTATVEIPIPVPVVSLTSAPNIKIFRGLTIAGDRITVKGLSIYGFDRTGVPTETTPGADIVISARLPFDVIESSTPQPPRGVTLIDNWLGLPPDESLSAVPSSFGVWLFDGVDTKITRNRIYHHGGSGILTSAEARNTQITSNIIVGNGLKGMPHAIYLEGAIDQSVISDNLLCGNDGSGVYLFKPEGNLTVKNNQIKYNGRRIPSAAVFLMGNDHEVLNNQIANQIGSGVTVAAYPKSDRNRISDNSFHDLQGLSIDLNSRHRTSNPFFKLGDGVNPPRDSGNRRKDTANQGINAPQFLSREFYLIDERVHLDGVAEPEAEVTLYQVESAVPSKVKPNIIFSNTKHHGPLSQPLQKTTADKRGRFTFTLTKATPGTVLSAIATKPEYGTSEPALNTMIKSLDRTKTTASPPTVTIPNCTTKPVAKVSQPPAQIEAPQPVTLRVPRNIHFALDKSYISNPSARVLDRIAAVLQAYPFLTIELQGHTDSRASSQYNLALSKRRAISTRNYLLQQGVKPERMMIRPLGESKLKKPGNTTLEHAYNRRVEVIFRDLRGTDIIFEEQNEDLQLER